MARILHIEDEPSWRKLVKERFADYHVDSAGSHKEAVELLRNGPSYDLALVDLKLEASSDGGGRDILDLLKSDYPETRRIVLTGSPPAGAVRTSVFERFDVEEIIIKSQTDAPDLRKVVVEALARPTDGLLQGQRLQRSELRQRFWEWRRQILKDLRGQIQRADDYVSRAGKVGVQSRERAEASLREAKARLDSFHETCTDLRQMLDSINTSSDLAHALDALDAAADRFGQDFFGEDDRDA